MSPSSVSWFNAQYCALTFAVAVVVENGTVELVAESLDGGLTSSVEASTLAECVRVCSNSNEAFWPASFDTLAGESTDERLVDGFGEFGRAKGFLSPAEPALTGTTAARVDAE